MANRGSIGSNHRFWWYSKCLGNTACLPTLIDVCCSLNMSFLVTRILCQANIARSTKTNDIVEYEQLAKLVKQACTDAFQKLRDDGAEKTAKKDEY